MASLQIIHITLPPNQLTYFNGACWNHMIPLPLINITQDIVLLPDGTKSLPEPMLTYDITNFAV